MCWGMRFLEQPQANERLAPYLSRIQRPLCRAEILGGWSRWELDKALRCQQVVRLLPGIYCASGHVLSSRVRGEAINLWAPQAWVSGSLALQLYSPALATPQHAAVLVPYGLRLRAPDWVRIRTVAPLRAESHPQMVRCATAERALIDAWHRANPTNRESVFYEAMWQRTCRARPVTRELEKVGRVSGRQKLEKLLQLFAAGATSPTEVIAQRSVFQGPPFAGFEWQVDLTVCGRRRTADGLHRESRVVLELDGWAYHSSPVAQVRDRERDTDFSSEGYVTLRFGFRDLRDRPQWCRERVTATVRARSR